jgi:ABC-type multidrug transport system ATPase subunit
MNIELNLLEKSYQKKIIFRNLSANFESGKRYGISGHNGSGKSTLLKIIAGFITPNSGTINYTISENIIRVESIFKHINFTAPYLDLPTDLSFYELMDFHFSMKERLGGLSNEQINENFQLPTALPIRQFSSGMLQRVKLALAFFTTSDLVLLDEPTETLDEKGFELYAKLLETHCQNRTTIIASNKEKDFIACESILKVNDYTNY